jgi:hypothetical protein
MGGIAGLLGSVAKFGAWGIGLLGGAVAIDSATDRDGTGGSVIKFLQNKWKIWTETSSAEQGRNVLLDSYNAGIGKIAGIVGFLMPLIEFLSPELAAKAQKWLVEKGQYMSEQSLDNRATGPVNADDPITNGLNSSVAPVVTNATNAIEGIVPDALDGGNSALATAEVAAAGLVAAKATGLLGSATATTLAGTTAAVGWRAIPVVAAIGNGAITLWNTGDHVLSGEFEKAGVELTAGAGLTVGSLGGVLTYSLGEAWHASVRDGSLAVLGEDAAIEKSFLRGAFEDVTGIQTDLFGTTEPVAAPAPVVVPAPAGPRP